MECVLRAWGQLKRGLEVAARCEMCIEREAVVQTGFSRWWQWVKYVLRAQGQLKRGFEVVVLGEICFEGMGAVENRFRGDGTG